MSDINQDYYKFLDEISVVIDKFAPLKPVSYKDKFKKSWMTSGLLRSVKRKNELYKLAQTGKIKLEVHLNFKNKLTNLIRLQKKAFYNDFIVRHRKNARAMWQLINSNINKVGESRPTFHGMSSDDLNNYFANLGSDAVKDIRPRHDFKNYLKNRIINSFFMETITPEEIVSTTKLLKSKSSYGYDKLSMKLIKGIIDKISLPLSLIFNKSFSTGLFPEGLKIARIIPVLKSGDKNDIKNYRPISLLPSLSKIIEKIILNKLITFFDKHNILNMHQHGFRPKYSTSTALTDVLDYITHSIDNKLSVIALFVDISKAFDSLNHNILIGKLEHYGIRGVILDWFISYLSCRYQYVDINNQKSLYRTIVCGIPQDSILGPYLYLIYVNDIFNVCSNILVKCVLFADDTTILVSGDNVKLLIDYASQVFAEFSSWFIDNRLALNCKKTNYVFFTLCKVSAVNAPQTLNFDIHCVNRALSVKYLGFVLDYRLSWSEHILSVNDKIAKGVGLIKFCCKVLPHKCLLSMYYSFVYSYLVYGIEHWGCVGKTLFKDTVHLQKKCIRLINSAGYYVGFPTP